MKTLFLFYFIYLILKIYSYKYFQANILTSGNLLLITDTHVILKETNNITYLYTVYNNESESQFLNLVSFAQFSPNDDYVICRFINITQILYQEKTQILLIQNDDIANCYCKIIPYKLINQKLIFITTYINSENKLDLIMYNVDVEMYSYDITKEVQLHNLYVKDAISCDFMYSNNTNNNNTLVCFLSELKTKNLVAISFDPENNLKEKYLSSIQKDNTIEIIKSKVSSDRTKSIVCYINSNNSYKCLLFNLIELKWSKEITLLNNCQKNNYETDISYIKDKSEFLVYIYSENTILHIFFFDENFKIKTKNELGNKCYIRKELDNCDTKLASSIFYSKNTSNYTLMIDCSNSGQSEQLYDIIVEKECNQEINFEDFEDEILLPSFLSFYNDIDNIIWGKINLTKNEIENNLNEIIRIVEIKQKYKLDGDNYNITISPIDEINSFNSSYVDFSECEKILKEQYDLPSEEILTILQIEIDKMNDKSLINQIEYAIFNEQKQKLDLDYCKDVEIKINYEIKNESNLNISMITYFSDLGVDILNIKDSFFNEICYPYSNSVNDVILEDRVSDIYQNYSLCDNNCEYEKINLESMIITCSCKIKKEINTDIEPIAFGGIVKSTFKNSNFGVIMCYNLVFSFKNKKENIGFWIFLFLIIIHIPLYIYYIIFNFRAVKLFIFKEMQKNNYLIELMNPHKKIKFISESIKNDNKFEIYAPNKNLSQNDTPFNIEQSNDMEVKDKINSNNIILTRNMNKIIYKKTKKKIIINNDSKQYFIKNSLSIKINNKIENINKVEIINSTQIEKEKFPGYYHLIQINANNSNDTKPPESKYILDNYDYDTAIKYENRTFLRIFYICLLSKENILNTFFFKSYLEIQSLRLTVFIFSYSCDFALNALFYLNQKISDKYHYEGEHLIIFTIINNFTISTFSTILSLILVKALEFLTNSKDEIENLFREEEKKMRENKDFKVENSTKKIIHMKLMKIFKLLNIKIIIYITIELFFMLFFLYYITSFCEVYKDTQISWFFDSFVSFLLSIITELFTSFITALLYLISLKYKLKILYKIVIFFYGIG